MHDETPAASRRRPLGGRRAELYAAAIAALGVVSLVVQPLIALDHDLWYHLGHGRHILAGGGIPDSSYFSFIAPARHWVDYYWLFGLFVALIERVAGDLGLIALRAALFAVSMAAVHRVVFARRVDGRRVAPLWGATLVSLVAVVLVGRYIVVRPHLMSYTLIAVSLYLLEVRPRWLPALPLLALLWVNLHGIEYPVLIAIVLSYLGAYFLARVRGRPAGALWSVQRQRRLACLGLAGASMLATPHGLALMRVPFLDTGFATTYIVELERLGISDVLRVDLLPLTIGSAINLLIILAVAAGIAGVMRRPLPVAQYGLWLAGMVLISRSARFQSEVVLLSLPLLAGALPSRLVWPRPRPALIRVLLAAGAVLPLVVMVQNAGRFAQHQWPTSRYGKPDGVARFLDQAAVGTRLLNHPNQGGYFEWALGPRMKIFTDMEVPFLFRDDDHYLATAAFQDPVILAGLVRDYRPDFIAVPIEMLGFAGVVAAGAPAFEPVFFDDRVALYVDSARHPALAHAWSLEGLDPLKLSSAVIESLHPADRGHLEETLERMLEIAPDVDRPRRTLAIIHWLEGRRSDALREVRLAAEAAPWAWQPLVILGSLELELGRPAAAARWFEDALEREIDGETESIERSLARAYADADRPGDAYRAFEAAVGRFPRAASAADLAQLGGYALAAGEVREARLYVAMARRKTAPEDRPAIERLDAILAGPPRE